MAAAAAAEHTQTPGEYIIHHLTHLGTGKPKGLVDFSVVMLALAARIVPGLHWPVMLATLVVCMQTYAFALLWRGRGSR